MTEGTDGAAPQVTDRIRWVLNVPTGDVNWRGNAVDLTDEELQYCLQHAKGKSHIRKLQAIAQKRGLQIPDASTHATERDSS